MSQWKMPPKAKVYEALSAVASNRVARVGPTSAEVRSSSGEKTYIVEWSEDFSAITSNDNASYWQGYIGYPIIAVLMALGKLAYNASEAAYLAGVHWKKINDEFKRDYAKAVDVVLAAAEEKGANRASIAASVDQIYADLQKLGLQRSGAKKRPPDPKKSGGEQLDLLN